MSGAKKRMATLGIALGLILTLAMVSWAQGKGGGKKPPKDDDTTPPAAIDDLADVGVTTDSVTLRWTEDTADDGSNCDTGRADHYDVRYSTLSIVTDTDWNNASQAAGEPAPGSDPCVDPPLTQTFDVTGLLPDTTYFFRLRVPSRLNQVW